MSRWKLTAAATACAGVAGLFSCVGDDPNPVVPTSAEAGPGTGSSGSTSSSGTVTAPDSSTTTCNPCDDAGARRPIADVWAANLVAYWPFDGDVRDYGPERLDLVVGATDFDNGIVGQGLSRKNTSTVKRPISDKSLELAGAFTIQIWLFEKVSGVHSLLGRTEPTVDGGWFAFQQDPQPADPDASVVLGLGVGHGSETLQGSAKKAPQKWRHLVFTRSSSGSASIYIDGAEAHTVQSLDSPTSPVGAVLRVGESISDATRNFEGIVDELAIWSEALSASDVASLFNHGAGQTLFAQK